jgi:hypothetical protein
VTIEPIGIDDAFWSTSNSLLKNLEIGSVACLFALGFGWSGCCERTLTYAASSLGMRIRL